MATKGLGLKQVACEEALDDWYAQSIGVEYNKYMQQKKLARVMAGKQAEPQPQPTKAPEKKAAKQNMRDSFKTNFVKNDPMKQAEKIATAKAANPVRRVSVDQLCANFKRPIKHQKPSDIKMFIFPQH